MKSFQLISAAAALLATAAQAAPLVFIANRGSDTVSVIDPIALEIVHTIGVGNGPIRLAVHPDGSKLYVANRDSDSISVVDIAGLENSSTSVGWPFIRVSRFPSEMTFSEDGSRLYVVSKGNFDETTSRLNIIDTTTNRLLTQLDVGNDPVNLARSPDQTQIFVATPGEQTTSALDISSAEVPTESDVVFTNTRAIPRRVYYNYAGTRLYVTNAGARSLTVIDPTKKIEDPASFQFVGEIPTQDHPRGMAFTPDGRLGYVTNVFSTSVTVFDVETDQRISDIQVGSVPWAAEVPPSGNHCFITNSGSGNVVAIEVASNEVVRTFPTGQGAYWLDHYDPGHLLFGTNPDEGTVSIIDTLDLVKIIDLPTGIQPWMCLVHDPSTTPLEVPDFTSSTLFLGSSAEIDVPGTGFEYGTTASVSPSDAGVDVEVFYHGPSRVSLTVNVSAGATPGLYDLTLNTPGGSTAVISGALTVGDSPAPAGLDFTSLSPAEVSRPSSRIELATVRLTGSGFDESLSIAVKPFSFGLFVRNITVIDETTADIEFGILATARTGERSLELTVGEDSVLVSDVITVR